MDDIAAVIAMHMPDLVQQRAVELSGRGVPIVLCGANNARLIVWPVDGHRIQTGRMNDQVCGEPAAEKNAYGAARPRQDSGQAQHCGSRRPERRVLSPLAQRSLRRTRRMSKPKPPGAMAAVVSARIPPERNGGVPMGF